jgi:hypothetical protein
MMPGPIRPKRNSPDASRRGLRANRSPSRPRATSPSRPRRPRPSTACRSTRSASSTGISRRPSGAERPADVAILTGDRDNRRRAAGPDRTGILAELALELRGPADDLLLLPLAALRVVLGAALDDDPHAVAEDADPAVATPAVGAPSVLRRRMARSWLASVERISRRDGRRAGVRSCRRAYSPAAPPGGRARSSSAPSAPTDSVG